MESGDFQLSERSRLREERDTLKRENAELRQALQGIRTEVCAIKHRVDLGQRVEAMMRLGICLTMIDQAAAREALDAARKEQE
jgi:hypothetical protein